MTCICTCIIPTNIICQLPPHAKSSAQTRHDTSSTHSLLSHHHGQYIFFCFQNSEAKKSLHIAVGLLSPHFTRRPCQRCSSWCECSVSMDKVGSGIHEGSLTIHSMTSKQSACSELASSEAQFDPCCRCWWFVQHHASPVHGRLSRSASVRVTNYASAPWDLTFLFPTVIHMSSLFWRSYSSAPSSSFTSLPASSSRSPSKANRAFPETSLHLKHHCFKIYGRMRVLSV